MEQATQQEQASQQEQVPEQVADLNWQNVRRFFPGFFTSNEVTCEPWPQGPLVHIWTDPLWVCGQFVMLQSSCHCCPRYPELTMMVNLQRMKEVQWSFRLGEPELILERLFGPRVIN
jgi:hypothetical protein